MPEIAMSAVVTVISLAYGLSFILDDYRRVTALRRRNIQLEVNETIHCAQLAAAALLFEDYGIRVNLDAVLVEESPEHEGYWIHLRLLPGAEVTQAAGYFVGHSQGGYIRVTLCFRSPPPTLDIDGNDQSLVVPTVDYLTASSRGKVKLVGRPKITPHHGINCPRQNQGHNLAEPSAAYFYRQSNELAEVTT